MGLPCLADKCAATEDCEANTQPDPWDAGLQWRGCPGKRAHERPDINGALTVRALAQLSTLSDWPQGYAAWVVTTWTAIESERNRLREGARG